MSLLPVGCAEDFFADTGPYFISGQIFLQNR